MEESQEFKPFFESNYMALFAMLNDIKSHLLEAVIDAFLNPWAD